MTQDKLLIVTDLDATLLSSDYTWTDALPVIAQLKTHGHALIFNSSKTHMEMVELAIEMDLNTPIIAENGGTIAIPNGWPQEMDAALDTAQDYALQINGIQRSEICSIAHQLRREKSYPFEGFSDWSAEELQSRTGLSLKQAEKAQARMTTEPILWTGSKEDWDEFEQALNGNKIRVLKGGRFLHLMGHHDKADGLLRVKAMYEEAFPENKWTVVALGDSPNDLKMLEVADIAVVIPSEHGPQLAPKNPNTIVSEHPETKGWAKSMKQILDDWISE